MAPLALALLAGILATTIQATPALSQSPAMPFRAFIPGLATAEAISQPAPTQGAFYLPGVSPGPATDLEQRMFRAINAERVAKGVGPYVLDAGLTQIARIRSKQMADQNYFGHRDPYGFDMYTELLKRFGYRSYAWAGEDLAQNNYSLDTSAERAVALLMTSAAHRDNILTTDFSKVGVGHAIAPDGRHIYTLIFLG